jgi:WASH complex subunit 7
MNISKDRLLKKNFSEVYLVDDGFALGCAFFLKLLNQDSLYNSIHWKKEIDLFYS